MPQSSEIKERPYHSGAWNLQFNTEYAHISSEQINLSKKQQKTLLGFDDSKLEILNRDLTVKTRQTIREPIGFVTRGDFS